MRVTRRGVFETNSSSTHSITIADSGNLVNHLKPDSEGFVKVGTGEFGWEREEHCDAETKLEYLVTYIVVAGSVYSKSKGKEIFSLVNLSSADKERLAKLRKAVREFTGYELSIDVNSERDILDGYIDHQSIDVAADILDKTVGKIKRYIFNPRSILRTDNDNEDELWNME